MSASPLIWPLLVPLLTAIGLLFLWRRPSWHRWVGLAGAFGLLAAGLFLLRTVMTEGVTTATIGGWPAPYGIVLAADRLSAALVAVAGLLGTAVHLFSISGVDARREAYGYYPALHLMLMGVCGAFVAGDIFNLYVWFEVLLMASFMLLELGGERIQLEAAIKYLALNLLASAVFLSGVGFLYGFAGSLNMADLAGRLAQRGPSPLSNGVAMLFLLAFGTKAALFPFFFWLPASYHAPPAPISAVFAGLLTKVGVYALYRTFTLMFVADVAFTHGWLMILAGLTMVIGLLGAVVQEDLRRVLSFNLVGHIGFMVLGLGLFTPLALAGGIFYTIHDMIDITILFLIAGVVHRETGRWRMESLGGFYDRAPFLSLLFLLAAFSLSGIPPLSGFWGKLALIRAALAREQYLATAAALAATFLTLLSMAQVWEAVFWKDRPAADPEPADALRPTRWEKVFQMTPIVGLTLVSLAMGLFPEPFFRYAEAAARGLLEPSAYILAVLGGTP